LLLLIQQTLLMAMINLNEMLSVMNMIVISDNSKKESILHTTCI